VRAVVIVILVLCFSFPAQAAPRFVKAIGHAIKTHKLLLGEAAAMEAAAAFDVRSTEDGMRRCPQCQETNIFLPGRPSSAELWGASAAFDLGVSAANWYALRVGNDPECDANDTAAWCKKKFWQGMTLGLAGEMVGLHIWGTVRNNGIN